MGTRPMCRRPSVWLSPERRLHGPLVLTTLMGRRQEQKVGPPFWPAALRLPSPISTASWHDTPTQCHPPDAGVTSVPVLFSHSKPPRPTLDMLLLALSGLGFLLCKGGGISRVPGQLVKWQELKGDETVRCGAHKTQPSLLSRPFSSSPQPCK